MTRGVGIAHPSREDADRAPTRGQGTAMGLDINANRSPRHHCHPSRSNECRHVACAPVSRPGGGASAHDRQMTICARPLGQVAEEPQPHRLLLPQARKVLWPARIARCHEPATRMSNTCELTVDIDRERALPPPIPLRAPVNPRVTGQRRRRCRPASKQPCARFSIP